MPYKDPEKQKQYDKEYYQRNKEKRNQYNKEYYHKNKEKNKEKKKEYDKEYQQTPNGKKTYRISKWKKRGIMFHDYDLLYDIYITTTHCDFCECELNKCNKSRKCVDHDHDIKDDSNVRGIICHSCNARDVLKKEEESIFCDPYF